MTRNGLRVWRRGAWRKARPGELRRVRGEGWLGHVPKCGLDEPATFADGAERSCDFTAIEHAEHELDAAKVKVGRLRLAAILARGWKRVVVEAATHEFDSAKWGGKLAGVTYETPEHVLYAAPDGRKTRSLSQAFALCRNRARRECGATDGRRRK